jgi:hypothetical protein
MPAYQVDQVQAKLEVVRPLATLTGGSKYIK